MGHLARQQGLPTYCKWSTRESNQSQDRSYHTHMLIQGFQYKHWQSTKTVSYFALTSWLFFHKNVKKIIKENVFQKLVHTVSYSTEPLLTKYITVHREVFTWVSKVISLYFGFALLCLVIDLKKKLLRNSRPMIKLNHAQVKPKPIMAPLCQFSRM